MAAAGKVYSIRRSSCSKDARNCDPRGQKNRQSRAIPPSSRRDQIQNLAEKLKENGEDRRGGEAGVLHLRNSSRVELHLPLNNK